MKKLATALLLLISFGYFSGSASADTLQLVSTGGQSVNGVYVYPYNFSINGSSALTPMMCLEFSREIVQGETWQVSRNAIPTGNTQTDIDYRALAIISYEIASATSQQDISDDQFAAWSIFADLTGNSSFTANAALIAQTALTQAAASGNPPLAGFSYANFTLFSPTSDTTGWTNGIPQEFMGNFAPPVPEPSSLMLLGTGVIGIAGVFRRRLMPAVASNRSN